ncbi:MAG: hypothetical protein KDI54_15600 [Gammaproteobacteria bacterium]|nr:hypothetical protein [Gammaproteobacteria bacterium]
MKETVGLVTALIALITAVVNFYLTMQQDVEINAQKAAVEAQQHAIEEIRGLAFRFALDITVDKPMEGEILPPVYDGMEGSFQGSIPLGHEIWVLAKDRYNYFLVYPPTQVAHAAHRWSQTNVRLTAPGEWQLALCLANQSASTWLRDRAEKKDWSGFERLPSGLEILRYVKVERK